MFTKNHNKHASLYSHLGITVSKTNLLSTRGVHHFEGYMPLSASSALAGLLGGGLAQAVASPADRLKVQLSNGGWVPEIRDPLTS